jgi:hypothetical protein
MKTTPKTMTDKQTAALGLLSMSLTVPKGFHGYLEMLTKQEQPQPVAAEWLARLETVAPGVTEKYWEIVNG